MGRDPDPAEGAGQWYLVTVHLDVATPGDLDRHGVATWGVSMAQALIRDEAVATVRVSTGSAPSVYRADIWAATAPVAIERAIALGIEAVETMGTAASIVACDVVDEAARRRFEQPFWDVYLQRAAA